MYMEYGLTSPRFAFRGDTDGVKLPLPRSGGDLFYVCPRKIHHIYDSLY